MILVLGATGTVGREVVARLVAASERVRAFVRNPGRAAFAENVEVVKGDLSEPETLLPALDGADAAFVLTTGPDALTHDTAIATALQQAGPRRVVKLSSIAAQPPVDNSYSASHAEGERVVREASREWTVLRPAGFMSNVLQWTPMINLSGEVSMPFGEIPRALIDPRDIAETAVCALTSPGHSSRTYALTGPEALTAAEQVKRVSAAIGRPVRLVSATRQEARVAMVGNGMDPTLADGMLASLSDPDPARGGIPLPTVGQITGHPARTFDDWLAEHVAEFG